MRAAELFKDVAPFCFRTLYLNVPQPDRNQDD